MSVRGVAEDADVGFHQSRDELHQNEAADVGCGLRGQRRQRGESLGLVLAVDAGGARIHDEKGTPGGGKLGTHQNRRGAVGSAATAVDR